MKYRKKEKTDVNVIGLLYLVTVRLVDRSGEKTKHRILLVGCEADDIERKVTWLFDRTKYKEIGVSGIEKLREKVHFISTVITQPQQAKNPIIQREEGSVIVPQITGGAEWEEAVYRKFAIGIVTTMHATDEDRALRKLGHALVSHSSEGKSHSGAKLSDDSTISIEEIPRSSGYAMPRDVSSESNKAHVMSHQNQRR